MQGQSLLAWGTSASRRPVSVGKQTCARCEACYSPTSQSKDAQQSRDWEEPGEGGEEIPIQDLAPAPAKPGLFLVTVTMEIKCPTSLVLAGPH
jgi:hypothetical protein